MKKILIVFCFLCSASLLAREISPKKTDRFPSTLIYENFPGTLDLRVRVDVVGEPVAQPARVNLAVQCKAKGAFKVLEKEKMTCDYKSARLSKDKKKLTVRFFKMNIDGTECNQEESSVYSVSKFCP